MAKQGQTGAEGLEGLTVAAREAANTTSPGKGLPPVHLWNPPFCGVLVTPVEKVGIRVDDAPFLAVEMQNEADDRGRLLRFRTNVDDWVPCDSGHRLRFEMAADGGLTPYLHVRADLWAKVTRALYYDLVDMGEERVVDGQPMFGIESGGEFFAMADAKQVRDAV